MPIWNRYLHTHWWVENSTKKTKDGMDLELGKEKDTEERINNNYDEKLREIKGEFKELKWKISQSTNYEDLKKSFAHANSHINSKQDKSHKIIEKNSSSSSRETINDDKKQK